MGEVPRLLLLRWMYRDITFLVLRLSLEAALVASRCVTVRRLLAAQPGPLPLRLESLAGTRSKLGPLGEKRQADEQAPTRLGPCR